MVTDSHSSQLGTSSTNINTRDSIQFEVARLLTILDLPSTSIHLRLQDRLIRIRQHEIYTGCLIRATSKGSMAVSMAPDLEGGD